MRAEVQEIPRAEVARAVRLVARVANVSEPLLVGHRPLPLVARWRHILFAAFRHAGYSYPQIAAPFKRDHTSVMSGIRFVVEHERKAVDDIIQRLALMSVRPPPPPFTDADDDDAPDGPSPAIAEALAKPIVDDVPDGERPFDIAIGKIDRALSEIMLQAKLPQDDADTATLRHHAGDLILSGVAILRRLNRLTDIAEYLPADYVISSTSPPSEKP